MAAIDKPQVVSKDRVRLALALARAVRRNRDKVKAKVERQVEGSREVVVEAEPLASRVVPVSLASQ